MKDLTLKILFFGLISLTACNSTSVNSAMLMSIDETETAPQMVDLEKNAKVSFKLTDAPNKSLQSVYVDIEHMEVLLSSGAKAGRLIVAKNLGSVDLLKLRDGVTLPLQDVLIPHGLQIQQIRLVLKPEGHFAVKGDGALCELKTPSAQKTGIKIIMTNNFKFEAGNAYNIVVDFDALESVVIQGNGRCLLKPVLKLKSATKTPIANNPEGPARQDDQANTHLDNSEVVSAGPGEVLVSTPIVNDTKNDGWDDDSEGSQSYPELTPEELARLY